MCKHLYLKSLQNRNILMLKFLTKFFFTKILSPKKFLSPKKIFDEKKFLTKKTKKTWTVLKNWSHRNINHASERHSLRALKHRPRCLAWPVGPASINMFWMKFQQYNLINRFYRHGRITQIFLIKQCISEMV